MISCVLLKIMIFKYTNYSGFRQFCPLVGDLPQFYKNFQM